MDGNAPLVLIKGAGDVASGVAHRLHRARMQVVMTELPAPLVVRRAVSFAQAVWSGGVEVEGVRGRLAADAAEVHEVLLRGEIAVIVDPELEILQQIKPDVFVEATMAKRRTCTSLDLAPVVIGLGPGFTAGADVHAVVETNRGHYLGRTIYSGSALPDTGIPGEVMGYTSERVLRAPAAGVFRSCKRIGDLVRAGETVGTVDQCPLQASISGILRGLLNDGVAVRKGEKAGDIDPRCEPGYVTTISDKARAIGGGVLEAVLALQRRL